MCDALPLGALRALWSLRAGTGPVEVVAGEAKSVKGSKPQSCSLCTFEASSYVVWMCGESKIWVRGTAQTREDVFSLEQWFSICGLKALRNSRVASFSTKGAKITPKKGKLN